MGSIPASLDSVKHQSPVVPLSIPVLLRVSRTAIWAWLFSGPACDTNGFGHRGIVGILILIMGCWQRVPTPLL